MAGKSRLLCGIDEAGRGSLAGSLVMAGVVLTYPIEGLTDSKKLSEKRREVLYEQIIKCAKAYHIVSFDAKQIDEKGISWCLAEGLKAIQSVLKGYDYLFDGNTAFGIDNVVTMVKADTTIPEVSAASILAKVTRDREMIRVSKHYPEYGFEKHKGYGTKAHREAIKMYGRCDIHRKSFKLKSE
jgi:ribonuclease HII